MSEIPSSMSLEIRTVENADRHALAIAPFISWEFRGSESASVDGSLGVQKVKESIKAMEMKADQRSGIGIKGGGKRESLWSISFVKG